MTAPCLLPDLSEVSKVEVRSTDYWPLMLDFGPNQGLREKFKQGDQSVYLRRKTTYNPTGSSVFVSTFTGLSETQDKSTTTTNPASTVTLTNNQMSLAPLSLSMDYSHAGKPSAPSSKTLWDWIFHLSSLRSLDIRERSLVMPSSFPTTTGGQKGTLTSNAPWLRLSAVDSKLVLERNVQNMVKAAMSARGAGPDEVRDRLWQLRLLFGWVDSQMEVNVVDVEDDTEVQDEAEGDSQMVGSEVTARGGVRKGGEGNGLWLRKEFIEEVRWKIWGVQVGDHDGR